MNKKIILFVMHELSSGGAERVAMNLANNFDREIFDVHLCLFKKTGQLIGSLRDDIIIHDLKAERVSRGIVKFNQLLFKIKPDFVFSGIDHVNLFIALQLKFIRFYLKQTKFISRENNIPSIRFIKKNVSPLAQFLYKKTINNFDHVIAQSDLMRNDLIENIRIDKDKVTVVMNPLDIENINRQLINTHKPPLFNTAKINILAIGALKKDKNFGSLLKTLPYLNSKFHVSIIGESPRYDDGEKVILEKIIKTLHIEKRVTMLGYQDNPYKFMKQSNLVVLTSLSEGFPNVILEANACGKFVVAFECPGVNSEIIDNGVNGFLVENGNIKALAETINKCSKIPHDEKKIRESTDNHHINAIVKHYEELLFSL